jgi:hypothetical protein
MIVTSIPPELPDDRLKWMVFGPAESLHPSRGLAGRDASRKIRLPREVAEKLEEVRHNRRYGQELRASNRPKKKSQALKEEEST